MPFPVIQAVTLTGRALRLPADLGHARNVMLVVLRREQQPAVASWVPYVKQLEQLREDLGVFEIVVLGRAGLLTRMVTNARLRGDIPNPSLRERTIPLYTDRAAFLGALGLPQTADMRVVLVDGEGEVLWHASGQVTPDKVQALAHAVSNGASREREA